MSEFLFRRRLLPLLLLLLFISIPLVFTFHVTHISECGATRGCWRLPIGCVDASDCETMVTWKHERRHLIIEIETSLVETTGQWLGIGFSKDELMGNDTVFECVFPSSKDGRVQLSHNTAKQNVVLEKATDILIRDGYASIDNGRAYCGAEWILDNIHLDSQERKLMHVISSGKYHLFFAFGDMEGDVKKNHGMVGSKAPWKSRDQVRFCQRCSSSFINLDGVESNKN